MTHPRIVVIIQQQDSNGFPVEAGPGILAPVGIFDRKPVRTNCNRLLQTVERELWIQ